jgi:hypothetical protein
MRDFISLTYDMSHSYVLDVGEELPMAVTNKILGWIRSRSLEKLCSCSTRFPGEYQSLELTRHLRQVEAFFKKNAQFSHDSCEAAAIEAFYKAEKLCRITNKRIAHYSMYPDRLDPELYRIVLRAQNIIHYVLGEFTGFLDDLPDNLRVTSGATSTRSRKEALPYLKVTSKIPATESAAPYIRSLAKYFGYEFVRIASTETNRVVTVPKNYKTNRTIACEPTGNLTLQLALDKYLKESLYRNIRIDLSDQTRNQELARQGSIDGSLATLDLSMASDTLSFNTVAWLLPDKWKEFAANVRVKYGSVQDQVIRYAKFSSMGNGATFTLETLIFAAISKAVSSSGDVSVYGDDIIIPTEAVPLVTRALTFLGFRINSDKSFIDGPFRESCGADWYEGTNVTPMYLRMKTSMKVEYVHIVNTFAAISKPGGRLEKLLLQLVEEENLPLVPWNGSSISGIWITPNEAYKQGLISNKSKLGRWVTAIQSYVPKTTTRTIRDSRTLFLWHLRASGGSVREAAQLQNLGYLLDPDRDQAARVSTSVPTYANKYRRKWVCWNPPAMATPAHLYRWTELLTHKSRSIV